MEEPTSPGSSDRRRKPSIQVLVNPFLDGADDTSVTSSGDTASTSPSIQENPEGTLGTPEDNVFTFENSPVQIDDDLSVTGISEMTNGRDSREESGEVVTENISQENKTLTTIDDEITDELQPELKVDEDDVCTQLHNGKEENTNTFRNDDEEGEIRALQKQSEKGQTHVVCQNGDKESVIDEASLIQDNTQLPALCNGEVDLAVQDLNNEINQSEVTSNDQHKLHGDVPDDNFQTGSDLQDKDKFTESIETEVHLKREQNGKDDHIALDIDEGQHGEPHYDQDDNKQKTRSRKSNNGSSVYNVLNMRENAGIRQTLRTEHIPDSNHADHQESLDRFNTDKIYRNDQERGVIYQPNEQQHQHQPPHQHQHQHQPPHQHQHQHYQQHRVSGSRSPTISDQRGHSPERPVSPKSDPSYSNMVPEYVPLNRKRASPVAIQTNSPTLSHRCESPVMRRARMVSPSTAHKPRRKMSSDARLGPSKEQLQYNMPPRRKISSEARLGMHYRLQGNGQQYQVLPEPRTRKVSFESKAYICGHQPAPLNDESFRLPEIPPYGVQRSPNVSETSISELPGEGYNDPSLREVSPQVEGGAVGGYASDEDSGNFSLNIPKIIIGDSTECISSADDNESLSSCGTHTQSYDNYGYDADEEQHEQTRAIEEGDTKYSENQNHLENGPNMEEGERSPQTPRKLIIYDADYARKLEAQRFVGRNGNISDTDSRRQSLQSYDETGAPKSILKRKESAVSTESALVDSKLPIKLRKDSLALFSDRQSDIEAFRKQVNPTYKRFSCKDIKQMWANRGNFVEKHKLHLLVFFIFSVTVAFVIIGLHFHRIHKKNIEVSRRVFFEVKPRTLFISDILENDRMWGKLGQNIPSWLLPSHCYENFEELHEQTCLKWKGHGILDIVFTKQQNVQCYNISWQLLASTEKTLDCFSLEDFAWFGPSNSSSRHLSIAQESFSFSSAKEKHHGSGTFSSVMDFYWLSSSGAALVFNSTLPIDIEWNIGNSRKVCVSMSATLLKDNTFSYHVCNGISMMDTHKYIHQHFFSKIKTFPDKKVLNEPHWSSLDDVKSVPESQTSLIKLANTINDNQLACSSIDVDGKWEENYGDFAFNERNFPNMTELAEAFSRPGCYLSLKLFPYFDTNSTNFKEGISRQFFVRAHDTDVPSLVKWQHGVGAMLDVSDPQARAWATRQLMKLVSPYDIQSFRLSYGTLSWLPKTPLYHQDDMSPNMVKLLFTELISSLRGTVTQETSGAQHVTTLINVAAKHVKQSDSTLCIGNLIPKALTIGLLGYPFISADGFDMQIDEDTILSELPSRDIYLRWMQLASFFPAMRYTLKPWSYDEEIVTMSRNLTTFHQDVIVPRVYQLEDDIRKGYPILRPLWWVNDQDPVALTIDDEFLVGNTLLVAPVLCEGTRERDIYFPTGVWKAVLRDIVIIGPKWVRSYQVGQYEVPNFERQQIWGEE